MYEKSLIVSAKRRLVFVPRSCPLIISERRRRDSTDPFAGKTEAGEIETADFAVFI
jgi:hypothetical protein